jgi:hypothetical protein
MPSMSSPPPQPRRGGTGCLLPIVAALAAAAIVIVIAVIVRGGGDDDAPDDPIPAVLEDPDAVVVQLDGELGVLALTYSPDRGDAVISGSDLAAPDGAEVYAVWRTEAGAPELVTTFRPDGRGTVTQLVGDADPPGDATYTVTAESSSPGDAPTGSVVASG